MLYMATVLNGHDGDHVAHKAKTFAVYPFLEETVNYSADNLVTVPNLFVTVSEAIGTEIED